MSKGNEPVGTGQKGGGEHLVVFHVDDVMLGIDGAEVQEGLVGREVTRVPMAPPEVSELMNLRGRVVTLVDVRSALRLSPRPPDAGWMAVVLRDDAGIALEVDRIDDVVWVERESGFDVPAHVPALVRSVVRRVYQREEGLLLALSTRALSAWWTGQPEAASESQKENGER